MTPKIKICGMKHNTAEVSQLQPDYLGFIFYEGSPRNFEGSVPNLPADTKRVGVFVDAGLEFISEKIQTNELDVVQLHGEETPEFCQRLAARLKTGGVEIPGLSAVEEPVSSAVEIWKVFSIKDQFDFDLLTPYEGCVDKFLFDTKGKAKGGNGYAFDWTVLKDYNSEVPIVLSGGIGLDELEAVKNILKTGLPIAVIDVNSKFEIAPGRKDVAKLAQFMSSVEQETKN